MKLLLKQPITKILLIFVSTFLLARTSYAYFSISETSELLKKESYRVGVIPQLLLTSGGGSNLAAFFDMPVEDDINTRFMIGSGNTDFWGSASAKWVPYPDYEKQPAIGFRGSFIYARYNVLNQSSNFYNFQFTPIISKIVNSRWGNMNPYIGLPLTIIYGPSTSTVMQLVVGNEWIELKDFQIGAEFDLDLSNSKASTSALTLHFNFPFDGTTGYRK